VTVHDGDELIVFDVPKTTPEVCLAQESEVCKQLAKPHVW
jgi:hypothetical protein